MSFYNIRTQVWAKIGKTKLWEEDNAKLLGINIDSKLSFDNHVTFRYVLKQRGNSLL